MTAAELAELDLFIPAMLAAEAVRNHGAQMSPNKIKELTFIATNDQYLADRAWREATNRKMDDFKGEEKK